MPQLKIEPLTLFEVESPQKSIKTELAKGAAGLSDLLQTPQIDFQVKILFPKRFEALRRLYCGR